LGESKKIEMKIIKNGKISACKEKIGVRVVGRKTGKMVKNS